MRTIHTSCRRNYGERRILHQKVTTVHKSEKIEEFWINLREEDPSRINRVKSTQRESERGGGKLQEEEETSV